MVVPFNVYSVPFTSHVINSPALSTGGGGFPAFIAFPNKHVFTFRLFKQWHRLGTTSARRRNRTYARPLGAGYRLAVE
jgi:hypothetical protein